MAGIQFCCRKLLVVGCSRVISRTVIVQQPSRGRHNLVFQVSLQRNNLFLSRTKLNLGSKYIYRFASTNVTATNESLKTSEATTASTPSSETASVESSSSNIVIDESSLPPIPSVDSDVPTALEFVTTGLGEPSIKTLGLGSWWPPGIVQQCLEFIHVTFDCPWWLAIAGFTFILRILTFQFTLSAKRDTTHLMNNMPQIHEYQQKISEAKRDGDYFLAATYMQEFQEFIVKKKINLMASLKPLIFQTPVFISMFWGLRGMVEAPVESFKTQGLFWFTDLTATDPYYILPVLLGTSVHLMIKLGADGMSVEAMNNRIVQAFFKVSPFVVFGITTQFSNSILWYWTVSNAFVLVQTALLKVPVVSEFFNIPKLIKHDPSKYKPDSTGFVEGIREGFKNAKLTKEVEEREQLNALTFQRAGTGAIPRTFKENPKLATKKVPANKV